MDTVAVPKWVDVAPARVGGAGRGVLVAAAFLVVVQLAVRGWVAGSGFFYWDDLILVGRAGSYSLWSADLLLYNHDGHFMPLAFATAWVVTAVAPLTWAGPVVSLVVLQFAASVAVVRMLIVLIGVRWAILVPLGFYLFCPLTLPAYAWWAAALNALPLQFALAWVIGDAVRLVETGRRRYAASGVVVLAVALLFFEKSVIVPFAAFAVAVLVRHVDGLGSALRVVARRGATLWGGSGVVIACWLAGYLTVVDLSAVHTSPAELRDLLPGATSLGIVPTLFGGPWSWERWLPSTPWADPPSWAVVAAWVALGALVLLSLRARLRVGPVWVTAAAYVLVAQLPVALARSGPNTAGELMQSLRYFADIAVVLTATGALILRARPHDHTPGLLPDERSRTAELFPGFRGLARVLLPGRAPVPHADSSRRSPAVRGRVRALFASPPGRAAAVLPDSQCDATVPHIHTPAHLPDPGDDAAVPHSETPTPLPDSRGGASTSRRHAAAVVADSLHDATIPHDHTAASPPDSCGNATTPHDRTPAHPPDSCGNATTPHDRTPTHPPDSCGNATTPHDRTPTHPPDPREDATALDGRAPAHPPDSWGDTAAPHDRTAAVAPDPGGTATVMHSDAPASACDLRGGVGMSRGRDSMLLAGPRGRVAGWVLGMVRRRPVSGGRSQGFVLGSRAAAALAVAFLVSSLWSTASFVESWRVDPTRTYVTNVKGALAGSDGVPLLEQEVPWDVLNPTAYPQNLVSRVLAPVTKPATFADSTPRLRMITDSGEIVEAAVWWNRSILPGPEAGCGHRIRGPQPSDVPLDGPMLEHEWTVQLNYLANQDGRITVSFEHGEPVGAPVREGLNTVYVRVVGSGSMLRISPRTPGLDLCLGVGPVGVASYDS